MTFLGIPLSTIGLCLLAALPFGLLVADALCDGFWNWPEDERNG